MVCDFCHMCFTTFKISWDFHEIFMGFPSDYPESPNANFVARKMRRFRAARPRTKVAPQGRLGGGVLLGMSQEVGKRLGSVGYTPEN